MGKSGKPQRSGKHKKMKAVDIFYTGDRPVDRHADKFNLKPRHEDDQEYSRSVKEMVALKTTAKLKTNKKPKRRKVDDFLNDTVFDKLSPMERGCSRPFKPAPNFVRRKGETEATFMHRVDRETMAVINKAQFEDKYNIGDDAFTLDFDGTEKAKSVAPSLKKKTRLLEKKQKLKKQHIQKKEDRCGDFKRLQDVVKFGEVVQAPPMLTVKPRKALDVDMAMIGSRKLLLSDLLSGEAEQRAKHTDINTKRSQLGVVKREIGKTIKSRKMSPAAREAMDRERERTIMLYRKLKESRQQAKECDSEAR